MTSELLGNTYKEMVSQVAIQMVAANASGAITDHRCSHLSCRPRSHCSAYVYSHRL